MRRPWQIWLVFTCGLAVAFAAMGWLSLKALDLEHDREQSRVDAELEEDVRQALWQADSLVMPILAQESAWPHFAYRPFYDNGGGKGKSEPVASPLLNPTNDLVVLNFEVSPANRVTSPQVPPEKMNEWAIKNGRSLECITESSQHLKELQSVCTWDDLLARLPAEQPIAVAMSPQNTLNFINNSFGNNTYNGGTIVNGGTLTANGTLNQTTSTGVTNGSNGSFALPNQEAASPTGAPNANNNDYAANKPANENGDVAQNTTQQGAAQQALPQQNDVPPPPSRGRGDNSRDNRDPQTKNSVDLAMRNQAYNQGQTYAIQQQQLNNKGNYSEVAIPTVSGLPNIRQGLGKAIWLKSSLLFARRVTANDQTMIQGCWLDWPKLREWLTAEIKKTLPDAELVAINSPTEETRGRMLATLPVKLTVPAVYFTPMTWYTPIRFSLIVAWVCALLGALAVGGLLLGVVTLSERRAAFVSAVTHELRTPLTTFRMYAEMLSEGMVSDPAQQKHYLDTLRAEADRLTHLVGNVLAYARLERGKMSNRLKPVPVAELIDRSQDRLAERAKQAELELLVEIDDETFATIVSADVAAVEQILFNLVDNASKYATSATDKRLHLRAEANGRHVLLRLCDHGPGVSAKEANRLFQPFRKSAKDAANSAPGVGLGLALSRRLARDLGGDLMSEDTHGQGACFVLKLVRAK